MLYTATVRENEEKEDLVTVSAIDIDDGENGTVSYQIAEGNEDGLFRIEKETGRVSLVSGLDRETSPIRVLKIAAKDAGVPQRSGFTTIKVYK